MGGAGRFCRSARSLQFGEISYIDQGKGEMAAAIVIKEFSGDVAVIGGRLVGALEFQGDAKESKALNFTGHAPLTPESATPEAFGWIDADPPALRSINAEEFRWVPMEGQGGLDREMIRNILALHRTRPFIQIIPHVRLERLSADVEMIALKE